MEREVFLTIVLLQGIETVSKGEQHIPMQDEAA